MQSLGNILGNSVEDGIDDFVSSFLFRKMREYTEPVKKDFESDSDFDGAVQNFITTLSMGLTLYAYMHIMEYIRKAGTRFTMLWAYIVAGKMKEKIKKLKPTSKIGKKGLRLATAVIGADKTGERIQVAKIINDNLNHIDNKIYQDKNIRMNMENRLLDMGGKASQIKGVSSQENFNLYLHKTKTSTWLNTNADKKLFERVTGEKITDSSAESWSKLVEKLNQYSEFAKNSEGQIFNLTEALLKVVNRSGVVK